MTFACFAFARNTLRSILLTWTYYCGMNQNFSCYSHPLPTENWYNRKYIARAITEANVKMTSVKCRITQKEDPLSYTSFILSSSIRRSGKTASEASFSLQAEDTRMLDK